MVIFRRISDGAFLALVFLGILLLFHLFQWHGKLSFQQLKRGLLRVKKRIALFLLATIAFGAVYTGSQYQMNSRKPTLSLKLNYEEAAKGINPNKTRFNVSEILSDEVLEEVISRGNLPITPKELSGCLSIGTSFDNREIGSESSLRIATEYWVSCNEEIFSYNLDTNMVMELLADVYYERFLKKFMENDEILNLNFEEAANMDYMDLDDYFQYEAQKLQRYINRYQIENPSYRLKESGESFASLSEKIDHFINVELERYRSYLLDNGLSRNPEEYKKRMEYVNRLAQVEREKNMASYNVRLETIRLYDEQMARIVLVPTSDQQKEFYMSRTKIGVDYFADEADSFLGKATELQKEIEHNDYAKTQMEFSAGAPGLYGQADEMVEKLQSELKSLSVQCKEISDTYIAEKRDGYLKIGVVTPDVVSAMQVKKSGLMTLLFFILLCGGVMTKRPRKSSD